MPKQLQTGQTQPMLTCGPNGLIDDWIDAADEALKRQTAEPPEQQRGSLISRLLKAIGLAPE